MGSGKSKVKTIQVGSKAERPFSEDSQPADNKDDDDFSAHGLRVSAATGGRSSSSSSSSSPPPKTEVYRTLPSVTAAGGPSSKQQLDAKPQFRNMSATLESWDAAPTVDTAMPLGLRLAAALVSDLQVDDLEQETSWRCEAAGVAVSTEAASALTAEHTAAVAATAVTPKAAAAAAGGGFLESPLSAELPGQVAEPEEPAATRESEEDAEASLPFAAATAGAAGVPASSPAVAVTCAAPMRRERESGSLINRRDDWLKSLGVPLFQPDAQGHKSPSRGGSSKAKSPTMSVDVRVSLRERGDCMKDEANKVFERYQKAHPDSGRNFGGGHGTLGIGAGGPPPPCLKV